MKNFTGKGKIKRITIIIILAILLGFTIPNYSHAADIGGTLFKPLAQLLATVGDVVIQFVQDIFLPEAGDIKSKTGGTSTPSDGSDAESTNKSAIQSIRNASTYNAIKNVSFTYSYEDPVSTAYYKIQVSGISKEDLDYYCMVTFNKSSQEAEKMSSSEWQKHMQGVNDDQISLLIKYVIEHNQLYSGKTKTVYSIKYGPGIIFSGTIPALEINFINPKLGDDSTASILRGTISEWYKDLQRLALVGLLSVLVYMAIRIIISSSSQDQAKYKKMLTDWLVAICIIFILHYAMSFILTITDAITDILKGDAIGASGEDVLMSKIRTTIGEEDSDFYPIFADIVMYITLVIFTVTFTFQYIRRVIYMAFLTMIAPLIALTYPLDKIKDGQAQAFSTWIKEYIFNALIQPVHLLLYYIFVGCAIDFVKDNPLYGVVAIFFMIPAEKFFRNMFGFNKASSVSTLGAMAGGAAVMSMIQKIKAPSNKKSSSSSSNEKEESKNSKVRTASNDSYANIQENGEINSANGKSEINKGNVGAGLANIGKSALKSAPRTILKGAGKVAGAATLGTVGFATGIASGDASKAFQNAIIAGGVGAATGGAVGDKVADLPTAVDRSLKKLGINLDDEGKKKVIEEMSKTKDNN